MSAQAGQAAAGGPLLAVNNIEVVFKDVILVLSGLSLAVAEGAIVALLGANGAGKSTTLKAISGLLKSENGEVRRGEIRFAGERIDGVAPDRIVRRGIFQVMEGWRIIADMTCLENLRLGAFIRADREVRHDVERVYAYFPRLRERNGAAGYLSGGEQQMLAIGRALMARPRLILMDEPSMGVSPCGRTNRRIRGWMDRADQAVKVRSMFVRPEQVADVRRAVSGAARLRLIVAHDGERDVMTLRTESATHDEGLHAALERVLQSATKLRGTVELTSLGSLPNDGKVIDDRRPVP